MDSLPFIVPIAGVVFLANAVWSCTLGCRVQRLQQRVEFLEDAQVYSRTQMAREQLSVPVPVAVATPTYYPPTGFPTGPPPPYRPMPVATAPVLSY
jgi:hypothetical protein